jgi:hypothetical protein
MVEHDNAVVEILCDSAKLGELIAIPHLTVEVRPMRTDDPAVVRISALADAEAQEAARALGCTVTVVKSAADYRAQVEDAYRGLDDVDSGSEQS